MTYKVQVKIHFVERVLNKLLYYNHIGLAKPFHYKATNELIKERLV